MVAAKNPELSEKNKYEICKGLQCPNFLEVCKVDSQGNPYFTEADIAYQAMALCNNWTLGLSDGRCVLTKQEQTE